MKTKSICLFLFAISMLTLQAQERKMRLAVFDPTSSGTGIDEGTKIAIREIISSTFVNTGEYTIVERSLLEKVMQEQAFSNSGAVDESQASEIGRLVGANKIVLSVVTLAGGRNLLSVKLVDVQTASVEKQKTKIITTDELLNIVEPLSLELMGAKASTPPVVTPPSQPAVTNSQAENTKTNTAPPAIEKSANPREIEMIYVEGANMGTLHIPNFYIGKYEVTQAQWQAIMGKNPSKIKGADNPVENISWINVKKFIKLLNKRTGRKYRLPTEDEWVYAASGGKNNNKYRYAGSDNIEEVAWYRNNSYSVSHVAGKKISNSLGIYDMSGNVWEWCQKRVLRGGAYGYDAKECTIGYRYPYKKASRYAGIRLVLQK